MRDDRATIRGLLGDVLVQPLGAGLDHRVYAVGDALVARFGERAASEAALLAAVAPRLPLPVPLPIAVDAEAGCLVLPRVPGTPLLEMPRAARRVFATQLRAFADALHALNPGVDVPEDDTAREEWLGAASAAPRRHPHAPTHPPRRLNATKPARRPRTRQPRCCYEAAGDRVAAASRRKRKRRRRQHQQELYRPAAAIVTQGVSLVPPSGGWGLPCWAAV